MKKSSNNVININNVIPFPKKNNKIPPKAEDIQNTIEENNENIAGIFAYEAADSLRRQTKAFGITLDASSEKDWNLVVESLKSLILKNFNSYHPIQDYAEMAINIIDEKTREYVVVCIEEVHEIEEESGDE